jgi:hypothetical protein
MTAPGDPPISGCPVAVPSGWAMCLLVFLTLAVGCGQSKPPAKVEGTLRLDEKPLDNCLVTFLPEPGEESEHLHATGLTDAQGCYRLCRDNQREGVFVGRYRVVVQDLSVSSGMRRKDHGTVDLESKETGPPPPVRRSRVRQRYLSPDTTPLRIEVHPEHQVIDLELE